MRNVLWIILPFLFVACSEGRLGPELFNNDRLDPDFSPTTKIRHIFESDTVVHDCFYENNYFKIVAFQPEINRYDWYFLDTITQTYNYLSSESEITTTSSGTFKVEIEKSLATQGILDTSITIKLAYCPVSLNIPEAFIPNGSEPFNTWYPEFEGVKNIYVKVTNDLDECVFESDQLIDAFDGTYESTTLPAGNYYYLVSGKFKNGYLFERRGEVELILQ